MKLPLHKFVLGNSKYKVLGWGIGHKNNVLKTHILVKKIMFCCKIETHYISEPFNMLYPIKNNFYTKFIKL